MTVEPFDFESHYMILYEWWIGHGWPPVPVEALPFTGFVVKDVCAGFMYKTDSSIAFMEFIVSNPQANPMAVGRGIKMIVEAIQKEASSRGFTSLLTFINKKSLGKMYERSGFKKTDEHMTHYVWRV